MDLSSDVPKVLNPELHHGTYNVCAIEKVIAALAGRLRDEKTGMASGAIRMAHLAGSRVATQGVGRAVRSATQT
jgi:hypothetical protein